MRLLPALDLLAALLLGRCSGSSLHTMKYFYTSVWDPTQGLPHFVSVGYVDGQPFVQYDSNTRKVQPQVSWMEKVGKEDPRYWDRETQILRGVEEVFVANLETLSARYNESQGLHTLQWMCGCELSADRRKGGFFQFGYNGKTFISFDKETLTWVAAEPQAQITRMKWDAESAYNQKYRTYLEEECIEWLKKYLSYRKEALLRPEKRQEGYKAASTSDRGSDGSGQGSSEAIWQPPRSTALGLQTPNLRREKRRADQPELRCAIRRTS